MCVLYVCYACKCLYTHLERRMKIKSIFEIIFERLREIETETETERDSDRDREKERQR